FPFLEARLFPVPLRMPPNHFRQRHGILGIAQRRPCLRLWIIHCTDHYQTLLVAHSLPVTRLHLRLRCLHLQHPFLSGTDVETCPGAWRLTRGPRRDRLPGLLRMRSSIAPSLGRLRTQVANQHVVTNIDNVTLAAVTQALAALVDASKLGIGRDPGMGHVLALIHLLEKDLPGLLVHYLLGDAGFLASLGIVGPLLGKEQPVIEQGVTVPATVPKKDAN